jgi:multidrug efflux pump subunit AcrB
MLNLFYRNRQLLILTLTLVVVWGLSALLTLPRMEDPEITQRFGQVITFLPGATPERVESLVTEKLEDRLFELEEIEALDSTSATGVSVISVELKESIRDVEPVWSKVRGKIDDAELPAEASDPEYEDSPASARALIVGLTWELPDEPNYTILGRRIQSLEEELRSLPGTDKIELFGEPDEEIRVEIRASDLARLGLTAQTLAQQIIASDAKVSAGQVRGDRELLLEVNSELDSLERIRTIPIQLGRAGETARLGDVATVTKVTQTPATDLAFVNGYPAVVLSATVESGQRVDLWAERCPCGLGRIRGRSLQRHGAAYGAGPKPVRYPALERGNQQPAHRFSAGNCRVPAGVGLEVGAAGGVGPAPRHPDGVRHDECLGGSPASDVGHRHHHCLGLADRQRHRGGR